MTDAPARPGLSRPPPGLQKGAMGMGAQKNLLGAEGNLHLKAQEGKKSLKIDRSKPHDPSARPEPLAEAPKSKACVIL